MSFALIYNGMQQDIRLFLFPPVLCAVFRAIFIWRFKPYKTLRGKGRQLYHCFRYGFWWGMDYNAYVLLVSFFLISLPAAFLPVYFSLSGTVRMVGMLVYTAVLYTAFIGKLIFYEHYHDIYNHLLWLGRNAEKHNLADVFFNENHGAWMLLSYVGVLWLSKLTVTAFLALPNLPYPAFSSVFLQYGFNFLCILGLAALFYYCRYGGTFMHDDKPEWDTIPSIVKKDIFLARATVDDIVALKMVWRHPLEGVLRHTDAEDVPEISRVVPQSLCASWQKLSSPAAAFQRSAKGARIRKPRHIFLIVGESYAQMPLDDLYQDYHIMDGARRFREDPHTASLNNFLPAGMLSRPSIVSLMTGIFDARLELNEREDFWQGTVATSLPLQLKKLGYRSIYWYGGNSTYGNFNQYAPAVGFDEVRAATDFCPPDAPRTWVGVYDHVFLEEAARQIGQMDDAPTFHFIYTTSNHGPYKMNLAQYGYDVEKVMPDAPERVKKNHHYQQVMGTYWYSDQAISHFVDTVREAYPDSLILVTGDHAANPMPLPLDILNRRETTLREHFCTSFAMYHRDIDQSLLAGNTIGGHMNILPTIFELIAPQGFRYYSLFDSLLEPVHHVVTPYHWLTTEAIGSAEDALWQGLEPSAEPAEFHHEADGRMRYTEEIAGFTDITGWIARHPQQCLQENRALSAEPFFAQPEV